MNLRFLRAETSEQITVSSCTIQITFRPSSDAPTPRPLSNGLQIQHRLHRAHPVRDSRRNREKGGDCQQIGADREQRVRFRDALLQQQRE